MFIAHGEFVRKNLRWLLAGVLVLLIPGFVALFTHTGDSGRKQAGDLPTIDGKPVNPAELQDARNAVRAQYLLRTGREIQRTPAIEDEITQQAVVRIVLLRKARALGIRVSDDEILQQVQSQPLFQNENRQFDPERYRQAMVYLAQRGLTEATFEAVLRDELTLARLQALVAGGVNVTPQQLARSYAPLHERMTIELVKLDVADEPASAPVTDDEARAYYEKSKEAFRLPARVRVRYAHFTISAAKQSIQLADADIAEYFERNKIKYTGTNNVPATLDAVKDEVRAELLALRAERLASDRATELSVKLVQPEGATAPDFAKLAAEAGAEVRETTPFAARDKAPGVEAGPQFNQAAFALTADAPVSDALQGKDGFYVLQLLERLPSAVPAFEDVKAKVVERLQRERALQVVHARGRDAAAKAKQAVAAGKSFADACRELKLKVTTPAPFSATDETPTVPAAGQIKQLAIGMATNSVSDFIPTETGGVFFHLTGRAAPDPTLFEKDKEMLATRTLAQHRQAIFDGWINELIKQQQVTFGRQRAVPVPIEEPVEETEPPPTQGS